MDDDQSVNEAARNAPAESCLRGIIIASKVSLYHLVVLHLAFKSQCRPKRWAPSVILSLNSACIWKMWYLAFSHPSQRASIRRFPQGERRTIRDSDIQIIKYSLWTILRTILRTMMKRFSWGRPGVAGVMRCETVERRLWKLLID